MNGHSSKRRKTEGVGPREYERLRKVAYNGQEIKDVIKIDGAPSHDPWNVDSTESAVDPRFDYLDKIKPIVAPKTLNEAPISLIEGGKAVPAVMKPRAGTSYNPLFEDWSTLLKAEGDKAMLTEQKRLVDLQLELERLGRIAAVEREKERDEAVQTEEESAWEGFESDVEGVELEKRRPERKTPQQRRKAEKRKERERKESDEKKAKERERTEKRILEIKHQVDRDARKKVLIQSGKNESGNTDVEAEVDDTVLRRRRLGKDALPEPLLELVLPDELQDSLRLLKPEGNLLKERFRNILMRGKLETRKPIQQPKKKKRTLTEKWTYKDFEVRA